MGILGTMVEEVGAIRLEEEEPMVGTMEGTEVVEGGGVGMEAMEEVEEDLNSMDLHTVEGGEVSMIASWVAVSDVTVVLRSGYGSRYGPMKQSYNHGGYHPYQR